jgi:hypothetical protein
LRENGTRQWNCKKTVHKDKRTKLDTEPYNSNQWHQRLSRGSETSTETLEELYYRALRSSYQGIKEMRDKKTSRVYDVPGDEHRFLGDGLRLRAQLNNIN